MDLAFILAKQVASMLIYLIAGVIAFKSKLVNIEQSKGISSVLVYIFSPCLIFQSFQRAYEHEKLNGLLFAIVTSLIATLFFIFVAKFIFIRKDTATSVVERNSLVYTNVGNLSLPLIGATLGMEAVFYSTGYIIIGTIFLWTHCIYEISGDKSQISIKRFFINPSIIAMVLGLIFFLFQIRLPSVVSVAVSGMGGMVGPLSLFIIGLILATVDFKNLFSEKRIYYIIALRLIVLPFLLILLFKITNFAHLVKNGEFIITVILIASYAPMSTTLSVFCQQFDKNADYSSKLTTFSTCLCIVTMPLMLAVSQYIL